jgi:uncharacterized protein YbbC (DUF1343 family)
LRGRKIGLITNQTGVTNDLQLLSRVLAKRTELKLVALFGPEHGHAGSAPDATPIDSARDKISGLPIYSLYGKTQKPTSEMLEGIDALVFDIQDLGVRFYTYAQTMSLSMEAASEKGLLFVVLDRPNPLSGTIVQGNVLHESFSSFLGKHPIALRHGMTMGELANLFNQLFRMRADLRVVTMKGWRREMWYDQTGMVWVPSSPGMPSLTTATAYPGMCLLEGTNVSEGRGTTLPFEVAGAPWIEGTELADRLMEMKIEGCLVRSTEFIPTSSKHLGQKCNGIQVHVTDRIRFKPVEFGLTLIKMTKELYPDQFEWTVDGESNRFHFDLLMGTDRVRKDLESGVLLNRIFEGWSEEIRKFNETRRDFLLYE